MHEGVSCIVAGRIKGRFGKPVAVLSETEFEDGRPALKGSVRSVDKVNVVELLSRHRGLFEKLGGHAMAAGFVLPVDAESKLRQALNEEMAAMLDATPDLLAMERRIDYDLSPSEATFELANLLEAFEPTGTGNLKPCLRLSGVKICDIRRMGAEKQHLRFSAEGLSCVHFDGVEAFGACLGEGLVVDLIGHLEINHWNGTATPQFLVQEVRGKR
jgi:single-stranded-DNA-specific exonuclease